MFAKSNFSKFLSRLAPQQGNGMDASTSDMIMRLRQMLSNQPRRPTNTGNGMVVQPAIPQPYQEEVVVPPRPMGPLSMPQDPGFNINTATNTFFKALGDRVASGQMTLDQARAAQAEMRNLQLNPAMANRAAATEIAQRNLGVGQYAPRPQGLTLSNVPQQGSPNALTIARGPVPLNQQGPGLGGSIGAFLGMPGQASQGAGMPPGARMLGEQMAAMLSPQPRQGSFVDTMPKFNMQEDPNVSFMQRAPQQAPQNAQAMAMGGLMNKYYGGAC